MKSIFLFAGEMSGDVHGEKLVKNLRMQYPNARLFGVGGPKMRWAGLDCRLPMEKFQVMGFVDVFFALPRLIRQFLQLRDLILKENPDMVFLIDYPGFNLAMAKSLSKRGFKGKVCQYICPSVWAWGKRRIPKMEKILDHLFVIFPFEKEIFNPENLQVDYVGHPLLEQIEKDQTPPIDVDPKYRVLALFPGSRQNEILRNFPQQIRVAKKLLNEHPDLFLVISVAKSPFSLLLDQIMKREGILSRDRIMLTSSTQNSALMKKAHVAIAKSGTNNLELALYKVPTVVTYAIGPLDLFIAKNLLRIRLPHYCIVNIVAKKHIYPELYGPNFTEEALYRETKKFLTSDELHQQCRDKCSEIDTILQKKQPEEEILQILKNAEKST
ncbi:MAG: lipid-A-disaccharide synthase [Simkaniaceae bacterium]|nr:lipid-A-disaccharide synthase [Candidatus Sacchlamyda saccharinae]